ncbi:hypothetical protein EDD80_1063 [Anseongella ginsenosidimutans]|uniref:Uncharacterized protein n=1 Tax=Anseongella ginsenosidimutans TaxID=496056 RepID=A0A4R3KPM9_9SPHI|nr:hypothetical protein EDD80_1063 [Anseongella ginsenosidimutans]
MLINFYRVNGSKIKISLPIILRLIINVFLYSFNYQNKLPGQLLTPIYLVELLCKVRVALIQIYSKSVLMTLAD